MPITRLGLSNPEANTDTPLSIIASAHLVSVVVANKAINATPLTKVSIWVSPANATIASQYAYICSNLEIPVGTSFETFRFAVTAGDTVYVRSSTSSASFSINGVEQEDSALPVNLSQTFTNKVIRGIDNTLYIDKGTTGERRSTAEEGYLRYNTETGLLEVKTDTEWQSVDSGLYTPLESTDWDNPPTTIAAALDELAARLRTLEA